MRVRRTGNSYAHPLVILISSPNKLAFTRFGVAASKAVGSAVSRNRAKRQIRAAIHSILPKVKAGWDVLLIARASMMDADWSELYDALQDLLKQAMILKTEE
jgi:ribonuclease P protein component